MSFLKRSNISLSDIEKKYDEFSQRLDHLNSKTNDNHQLLIGNYLIENLFRNPKYQSAKKLNRFEYQVFSQFGEDGIIAEIFNRIGITNNFFIEFGVENGTECNTANLILKGWKGLWIEANKNYVSDLNASFKKVIAERRLVVLNSFITAENIEDLFREGNAPSEPDLLSIDIDRNDYHIWNAITNYRPRLIIIEYNAIFRPGDHFIVKYDANTSWDGSSNFGASLDAYYELGLRKGYKLVACNFAGVNAFFVREDLVETHFEAPYTPINHYEPPRYFLYKKDGHYRKLDC